MRREAPPRVSGVAAQVSTHVLDTFEDALRPTIAFESPFRAESAQLGSAGQLDIASARIYNIPTSWYSKE